VRGTGDPARSRRSARNRRTRCRRHLESEDGMLDLFYVALAIVFFWTLSRSIDGWLSRL
jgi:hypothetical protein